MNGGDLICNLRWLGNSGKLMKLVKVQSISSDKDECDNDNDADTDKGYGQDNDLVGHGVPLRGFCRKRDSFEEDRNIHCALPEMDNTLSNWTLHGQNLGKMLRNYKRQYRNLPSDHCRELGHFFNTTSAVLDTIGSMTENSILHSVQFFDNKEPMSTTLTSGGMDNAPQLKIPPTDINLLSYVAFFPNYQLDNGNVLKPNPTFGVAILLSDYPPYSDVQKLCENSALPVEDKEYSTDDNSNDRRECCVFIRRRRRK